MNVYEIAQEEAARILEEYKCNNSGFVYLLYAKGSDINGSGRYKIGKTKDINRRYKELTSQSPFEIEHISTFWSPNASLDEKLWHSLLSEKRIHGEWFCFEKGGDISIKESQSTKGYFYNQVYFPECLYEGYNWQSCVILALYKVAENFLTKGIYFFLRDEDEFFQDGYSKNVIFEALIPYIDNVVFGGLHLPTDLTLIDDTYSTEEFEGMLISKIVTINDYVNHCKETFIPRKERKKHCNSLGERIEEYLQTYNAQKCADYFYDDMKQCSKWMQEGRYNYPYIKQE